MKSLNGSFPEIHNWLTIQLSQAPVVHVGEWQAIRSGLPQEETIELEDISFEMPIPGFSMDILQSMVLPNLPWAEDHFKERVSGIPFNPPPSHEWWPFAQHSNDQHRQGEIFSHTYPERMWAAASSRKGIRFDYGDLADLVVLLKERTGTRQAYLPIWFPEDLSATRAGARVPCTLGYHFLIRNGRLKIVYYIRSCDFYRHFRDDVYMAARLAQWVSEQIPETTPSRLVMHISSLHVFSAEKGMIDQQAKTVLTNNILKVR
jgi:thymidylate synthase